MTSSPSISFCFVSSWDGAHFEVEHSTNPTFGAGLRFAQYGFDFGYTAGEQGHPRSNTMFFSINIGV